MEKDGKRKRLDGAATHRRARIKVQGGVAAPAAVRMREMGGVNAAVEVGKHKLDVALDSDGELFSEPNQPRAITRLAKRFAQVGCERVLIEGGSYQNVLVGALRAAVLPVVIINPRRVREFAKNPKACEPCGQPSDSTHNTVAALSCLGIPLHLLELQAALEEPMPHITPPPNGSTS